MDTGPSLRPLLPAVVVVACGSKLTSRSLGGRRPAKSELVDTQPASRTRPTCGQELRASIQRRKKKSRNHVYCMYKAPAPLAWPSLALRNHIPVPDDNKRSILFRFHVIFLASRSRCALAAEKRPASPAAPAVPHRRDRIVQAARARSIRLFGGSHKSYLPVLPSVLCTLYNSGLHDHISQ